MLIISVILIIISFLLAIWAIHNIINVHNINENIDKQNQANLQKAKELELEINNKNQNLQLIQNETINKNETLIHLKNELNDIQNNISKTLENQKELSQKAFENYCKVLENDYENKEKEYDMYKDALETSYSNYQLQLLQQTKEIEDELKKIKQTRAAAIQANLREKEIEEKASFYCLSISEENLNDIKLIETIKPKLINKRIIDMLIWQNFFQKPMNTLCSNVIGTNTQSGIYKITNQVTKECYIGQAVDLASRWKQHAKHGLNIDTPANNKLYQSMQKYGIWNFSWEVIEKCSPTQLNEKEKYYIDLYQAKDFGFNSTVGNK